MQDLDLASILSGGFGTGLIWGFVALVRMLARRGLTKAQAADKLSETADKLSGTAVEMVNAVREDSTKAINETRADAAKAIAQARRDAAEAVAQALQDVTLARRDADDARREANTARSAAEAAFREAEAANALLRRLAAEIWAPTPSIERLRLLVGDPAPLPDIGGQP